MGKKGKDHLSQSKRFLRANFLALGDNVPNKYKSGEKSGHGHFIRSAETFEKYASNIANAAKSLGVAMIRDITPEMAQGYLEGRAAAGIGHKQIHSDCRALSLFLGAGLKAPEIPKDQVKKKAVFTPGSKPT